MSHFTETGTDAVEDLLSHHPRRPACPCFTSEERTPRELQALVLVTQLSLEGGRPGPLPSENPSLSPEASTVQAALASAFTERRGRLVLGIAQSQRFLSPYNRNFCLAGKGPCGLRGHGESRGCPLCRPGLLGGLFVETGVSLGTGKPGLLLSMLLGPGRHPLESPSLRDARSEQALQNSQGLGHWGAGGSHMPGYKALCGGSLRYF